MNQTQPKKKGSILSIIVFVLSLILIGGIKTLFKACTEQTSSNYMTCHWAEQTVFALAVSLLVLSVVNLLYKGRGQHGIKAGLCLSMAPVSAACALIPGVVIRLCMMETMRCHTTMRPAVTVLCILLSACSLAGFVLHRNDCGKHHAQSPHPENHV